MQHAVGLNVTTWGSGDPALLVHGSLRGEDTWREQRPLAGSYRLLLVDRRGFGGSPAVGRVDFDRDADDVAGMLDEHVHSSAIRTAASSPCWLPLAAPTRCVR